MKEYVGHSLQIRGAERYILQDGKGDGMHFICVRNGRGLELWISVDRCGDLSRVIYKGDNLGYFSPCGYVAPQFYDREGAGFLKSFTAGFCTTCGLTAVGQPCTDEGEKLPLHGTVSHIPAVLNGIVETDEGITITLTVEDNEIFAQKLTLKRVYTVSYTADTVTMTDTITNDGDAVSPFMLLYHCNMGYPLLSETSTVRIPHTAMEPRGARAADQQEKALQMEPPQAGYTECCYYYDMVETAGVVRTGIYSNEIDKGVVLCYDKAQLPCFTEWKMMGQRDYVLGLEPGNCNPDGRDVLRREGRLPFLQPGESKETGITFLFTEDVNAFDAAF